MQCKDLAVEYGTTPMHIGRLRKQLFPGEKGELSPESEAAVREVLDELYGEQEVGAPIVKLKGMNQFNRRFIYAHTIPSAHSKGRKKVLVALANYVKPESLVGKTFFAEKIEDTSGKEAYLHDPREIRRRSK